MDEDEYIENVADSLEDVPSKWKRWFRVDRDHSEEWRKDAREDYEFVSGRQWSEEDEERLKAELRPVITFNRSEIIVDAIQGNEILNRNEVRYIPREQGDAIANELYSEAGRWFDDQAEAEDEDSEAFRDSVVCGMGWTETRLDFDDDPDGMPVVDRVDPLEMYWDCGSTKANLIDARRLWRVKSMSREEAEEMFPGVSLRDIDAGIWADSDERNEPHNADPETWYDDDEAQTNKRGRQIKVIHLQWWEWEDFYKVADPMTGEIVEMEPERFDALDGKLRDVLGTGLKSVKQRRKKYMQAFIGRKVLFKGENAAPRFTWNCITGKRDRNRGTWYGIVRAMKDPQRWANKWLSQLLHIINSNAKGGLMIEESAVAGDIRDLEQNWARPDKVVVVGDGAIARGSVQQRPPAQFPAGYQALTEFAVQAIRDVTGVSLEMLGMREATQSGVLEYQRRQAGMAVLAQLFNSLRRYRKRRGFVMLHYIQNYLSDGRLVRIVGEDRAKYVPLLKQTDAKFDVIVDESATSPNQKEMIWQSLIQILPGIKDMVPPNVMMSLLDYSPLPASVVQKIKDVVSAPNPQAQMAAKLQAQKAIAEVAETEASAGLKQAQAQKAIADANRPPDGGTVNMPVPGEADETMASAMEKAAAARLREAQAQKTMMEMALLPRELQVKEQAARQRASALQNRQ